MVGSQLLEVKRAPTLGREVQSQQDNWKLVGVQQFCPTMGREGVLKISKSNFKYTMYITFASKC